MIAVVATVGSLLLGACDRGGDGGGSPTPAVRDEAPAAAGAAPATGPGAAGAPTRVAGGPAVALEVRGLDLSGRPDLAGADFRPGPWSPDGTALVVWSVVGEGPSGALGRAWLVDAPRAPAPGEAAPLARPVWDSGDVETALTAGGPPAAVWRPDGALALARTDEPLVDAAGRPLGGAPDIGARQLDGLIPAGAGRLAVGGSEAWWLDADGGARAVTGAPPGAAVAWAPRADGAAVAAAFGRVVAVADLADGGAGPVPLVKVAALDAAAGPPPAGGADAPDDADADAGAPVAPRWLADGRLFVAAPAPPAAGEAGHAHRIVDPGDTSSVDLHVRLGLPPAPVAVADAGAWVAPGGAAILYPEIVAGPDGPAVRASWLYDVAADAGRRLPPMVDARWSPDGGRLAWVEAGALLAREVARDEVVVLAPGGAAGSDRLAWSPDGRWLLYAGAAGDLWLARADATAAPARVAETVAWAPDGPSWAPGSDRFAAAVPDAAGAPRLVIADLQAP